jgi:hypothetical protein
VQFTLRCEATINPIPAETEQARVPTWTRRGCASAATTTANIAMAAMEAKNLGDIFFPLVALELTAKRKGERNYPANAGQRPSAGAAQRLCLIAASRRRGPSMNWKPALL